MSTVQQIITRAMRRLQVLAPGEDPSALEIDNGTNVLNSMLAAWKTRGVDLTNSFPLGPEHDKGVIAMLAVDMAPEFGKEPTPMLARDASDGWTGICGAFMRVPVAQYDIALLSAPAYGATYSLMGSVATPDEWKPVTDYSVGDTVIYRGVIYECTTAGTSGDNYGPTERDSSVTDNTVVWSYEGTL